MELIYPKIEAFASKYTTKYDGVIKEIEEYTFAQHPHAHMLSGSVQGKLLEMISCMIQPKRILEIGTFTGFSALCLLKGLQQDGKLHTIELREEDAGTAANYFNKAGVNEKIILHRGDATLILPSINEIWDLVFIDADKVNYIKYYELTLPLVRKGGWIIADNVFFHGQVLQEPVSGKNATSILAFNEYVAADKRVEQVMLTVRDGLMIIRKK